VTDSDLQRALRLLGLSPKDILEIRRGATYVSRKKALVELRSKAKRAYKQAALKLHPDVNGGDEAKTADFRLLNQFIEELDHMEAPKEFSGLRPGARATVTVSFTVRVPKPR